MKKIICHILLTVFTIACHPIQYENFIKKNPAEACRYLKQHGVSLFLPIVQEVFPHPLTSILGTTFTEGFFYKEGKMYESGGPAGQGGLYSYYLGDLTAKPIMQNTSDIFPEGIASDGKSMILLTEKAQYAFVFDWNDLTSFTQKSIKGIGWGLTFDGHQYIKSDGSNKLAFLDPNTLEPQKFINVVIADDPIEKINELEFIDGSIFANIWFSSLIVKINPNTGHVEGIIDASTITELEPRYVNKDAVLNGIAYHAELDLILLTGKRWGSIYGIKLIKQKCP